MVADGTELFYRSDDKLMSVAISFAPELRIGEPQLLCERPYGENRREHVHRSQHAATD